jgi:hypothetical protein
VSSKGISLQHFGADSNVHNTLKLPNVKAIASKATDVG